MSYEAIENFEKHLTQTDEIENKPDSDKYKRAQIALNLMIGQLKMIRFNLQKLQQ